MFIIGIIGLSCSGKTTLGEVLSEKLGKDKCLLLSLDDYYKELTEEEYKILHDDQAAINFDCPEAINYDLLNHHLASIRDNVEVSIPKYDLGSCVVTKFLKISPGQYEYIILEGCFLFCNEVLRSMFNLTVWVDTSEYVCALRRFMKYTKDIQGYNAQYVYNQCIKHVIPGQEKFIKPFRSLCDVMHNGEKSDPVLIDMLIFLIRQKN